MIGKKKNLKIPNNCIGVVTAEKRKKMALISLLERPLFRFFVFFAFLTPIFSKWEKTLALDPKPNFFPLKVKKICFENFFVNQKLQWFCWCFFACERHFLTWEDIFPIFSFFNIFESKKALKIISMQASQRNLVRISASKLQACYKNFRK